MKMNLRFVSLLGLASMLMASLAQAANSEASGNLPPPVAGSSSAPALTDKETPPARNVAGTLSVKPLSLMAQRLHEAALPAEAELRCLFATACEMGLTRGFAIGSDLGAMMATPLFKPIVTPGRWLVLDGYVAFQFLRAVDEDVYFNAGIGYRVIDNKDSDDRSAKTSGLTFRLSYAQQIFDFYSQGVVANGFYASNTVSQVDEDFRFQASDDKKFIDRFYRFSQAYPRFRLGFPADFEVINWRNTHIDLPNHLRGYARVEPFFIQNEFREVFPEIAEYHFIERNFGMRLAYLMSYVSPKEKSGRLGFLGGIGFDVQASDQEVSYDDQAQDYTVMLPKRQTFGLYWEAGASYQF